jgi:WD40 repeat protein
LQIFVNEIPLGHINYADFIELVVQRNVRPERPDDENVSHLSDAVWGLAEKCWGNNPLSRPTASALCDIISDLLQTTVIAGTTPTLPPSQITHAEVTSLSPVPNQMSQHHPADTPILTMHGHTNRIVCVTFSHDGKYILSGSDDRTIRMWDARTGDPVLQPLKSHTDGICSISFSLDGSQIASGGCDNTALVWDTMMGQVIAGPFQGHTKSIFSVSFSPDGKQIVTGSADKTIRVWDIQTEQNVVGPLKGHTDHVYYAVFSADGKQIASASRDTTVRVWDVDSGRLIQGPLTKHTDTVYLVEFSPDGKRLVSGAWGGYFCVWDVDTGSLVSGPLHQHAEGSLAVALTPTSTFSAVSPDGKWLAGYSSMEITSRTIQVWDSTTAQVVANFDAQTKMLQSVTFSPDSKHILVSSPDNIIRVYAVNW